MTNKVKGATGMDYLKRDVGAEVMPEDAGWNPTILYDSLLYSAEFSIDEVVDATVKILGKRFQELIEHNENTIPTVYRTILEKESKNKRIVLLDNKNYRVAESDYVPIFKELSFRYKKVEYVQSGSLGKIFYRPL